MDDRFSLAQVGTGAILLDTTSGAILELNESAAFVWERKLNGESTDAIVNALISRYSLPRHSASQDVDQALSPHLETDVVEPGDFQYKRTSAGYSFTFNGQTVFELDADGQRVTLASDLGELAVEIPSLLRALAPKLLALRGDAVLHASAVEMNGAAVAFAGSSGAGKTTTGRALAQSGGRLLCEDQLVFWAHDSTVSVSREGERAISDWVSYGTKELRASGEVECGGLSAAARQGERLPLKEIGFLDVRRRVGENYRFKDLRPWETAGFAFRNSFYGSDERGRWLRQLELAARIGRGVTGVELVLPDGVDQLAAVMRRVVAAATLRA